MRNQKYRIGEDVRFNQESIGYKKNDIVTIDDVIAYENGYTAYMVDGYLGKAAWVEEECLERRN